VTTGRRLADARNLGEGDMPLLLGKEESYFGEP
jgi:hypothetical protein